MKKNFPEYLNQAWFARAMYPNLSSASAQVMLSRKLSGKRPWDAGERGRLADLFTQVVVELSQEEYLMQDK